MYKILTNQLFALILTLLPAFQAIAFDETREPRRLLGEKGFQVSVAFGDLCKEITVEHFWQAYHPGEKSRKKVYRGTLNEDNPGTGFDCLITKNKSNNGLLVHVGELINSQRGGTRVSGLGGQYNFFTYRNLSVTGRLEVALIEYGVPLYNAYKRGFAPIPSLQVTYTLPERLGGLGIRQYRLPVERITLLSLVYTTTL